MEQGKNSHAQYPYPLTSELLSKETLERLHRVQKEFVRAFSLIKKYPRSVTFFGSSRAKEGELHYEQARALAGKITKELGYAITTGGGGGIMEAANRGALEAGGTSIGLNITLPSEQTLNSYTTDAMEFRYFFIRKVALSFAAEAYVFFPGGYGTLDEFFEIITLIQTGKIEKIPIVLVGRDYWNPLNSFIEKTICEDHHAISRDDMNLYKISDNEEEILSLIKSAPVRSE